MIVPIWVNDFDSFCRWAHSDDFPVEARISFLNGEIWVDFSREELFTHNQVRLAFGIAVHSCQAENPQGAFVAAGMFYSNRPANFATEPDGMFHLWSTMKSSRLQLTEKRHHDYMEITGATDMALEIVSQSSVRKDTEVLRDLYWKAGVTEYWLVDARSEPAQFDILRHTDNGYVATVATDGWLRSEVLGREFRLARHTDPLGHPQFVVEVR